MVFTGITATLLAYGKTVHKAFDSKVPLIYLDLSLLMLISI